MGKSKSSCGSATFQFLASDGVVGVPSKRKENKSRCSERAVKYTKEREIALEKDPSVLEMISLLVMVISVTGVTMNWKFASWISFILSFINIGNYHCRHDVKQIFSSIFISGTAIVLMYSRDDAPLCE